MLTHFQSGHASPILRAFTRLMAFVCLWMGTVSVAHHTDGLRVAGASHSVSSSIEALTPQAPDTPCVACEWLLSLMPHLAVGAQVTLTPASRLAFAAPAVRCTPRLTSRGVRLRGPPSFLDVSAVG
ncbi:MAG: hypothetical protein ABIY70_13160 [Capsulimonas sp.]|uniref:hypothetical protein n=1 Tax=Capsulimonas sp. TaxID=2494211 RepID=UPI0032640A88